MSVAARMRVALARRPWMRWIVVITLALTTAQIVRNTNADLAAARQQWDDTRTVFVASAPHLPGDDFVVERRELPLAAIPADAVDEIPAGSAARRHLTAGQVIVADHLAGGTGPTALAADDEVVVAVRVVGFAPPPVGTRVRVVGEGVVLAHRANVVGTEGDVAWVALPAGDAPIVADGVRRDLVSLVLVP